MSDRATQLQERAVDGGGLLRYELAEWRDAYSVTAGITAAGPSQDFSLTGPRASADPWNRLLDTLGRERFRAVKVGRQVHGADVAVHGPPEPGVEVGEGVDGHVTTLPGVLVAVTVADCVPVYLVDRAGSGVALLHAGWRGVAAGMLERGVETLTAQARCTAADIVMHCGVSICGDCYEVGPEVVHAVTGRRVSGPARLDLRSVLVNRAARIGLTQVTTSPWCAAHHGSDFWSHRGSGGKAGRMVAFLGRPLA